jgi:hypothetical protein
MLDRQQKAADTGYEGPIEQSRSRRGLPFWGTHYLTTASRLMDFSKAILEEGWKSIWY